MEGEWGIQGKSNSCLQKLTFGMKHGGGGASHSHQYTKSLTENISEG